MANHLKCYSSTSVQCLLLLLSCIASMSADLNSSVLSHETNLQHSVSYNPQPQDFPNEQLYRAYMVIQSFKNTITCDPKNITATWIGHDICGKTNYSGFYCAAPHKQAKKLTVTAVVFDGFGLCAPKLQGFADQLPDVALFQAASNNFGGEIPRLDGLSYQYNLNFRSDYQPHFSFEEEKLPLLNAGTLVYLRVNSLPPIKLISVSGPQKGVRMPGAMSAKALFLNNNNLSGPLPTNLGFSKLSYLALANNKLIGPIPPSIAHMQDTLLEVLLLNNQLSGCLPPELGMLNKAAVIDTGMNQLTGPIPSSFACLRSVEQLNMAGNRLYGEIPDALCKLAWPASRLANLTLTSNYFTSVGPACSALIKDGVLDVKNNCIPGYAKQRRPAECASFLSQPKTCPAASSTHVSCPAAAVKNVVVPEGRVARGYSSYVTYATLHE